jgi:hypothetical protein
MYAGLGVRPNSSRSLEGGAVTRRAQHGTRQVDHLSAERRPLRVLSHANRSECKPRTTSRDRVQATHHEPRRMGKRRRTE